MGGKGFKRFYVTGASGEDNIDWISNDTTEMFSVFLGANYYTWCL